MKRAILLSIILLIGLLFIRAPSYAETGWLEAEGSSLSPLSVEARRLLEYESIERMRDSLGEEAPGLEAAEETIIPGDDPPWSAGGDADGLAGSPGQESGAKAELILTDDGLAGIDGKQDIPQVPTPTPAQPKK